MRTKVRLNYETSDKYSTFYLEQISHPGANLQKANARPWEQEQLRMPDKRRGGGGVLGNHGIDWDISLKTISNHSRTIKALERKISIHVKTAENVTAIQ
jgi:hypothetical protein